MSRKLQKNRKYCSFHQRSDFCEGLRLLRNLTDDQFLNHLRVRTEGHQW